MEGSAPFRRAMMREAVAIPDADPRENNNADEREQRKPDDRLLAAIDDDRRGEQRPE